VGDDGEIIFIEVKATRGGINSAFYISPNELRFSLLNEAQYRIYRLFEVDTKSGDAKFYILRGNVALRQRQRQPPLDNQLGVFLCLQISHRSNHIEIFLVALRYVPASGSLILESIVTLVHRGFVGALTTGSSVSVKENIGNFTLL
jgi:hypothetical protein